MKMIPWRSFLTSGLMLLFLTGCQSKSFNEIVKETKKSVALISYGDKKGHGTGFFVKVEGQCAVLTADHVVRSSKQIKITPHVDKKLFNAANIEEIPDKDLAVITFQVNGEENCPYTALKLNKSHQIKIFDPVVMVGYPTREGEAILVLQSSKGEISSIEDPPLPEGYAISYDITTVGGMSGAPVINQWGEVVAVHGKTDVEIVSLARSQQSSLSIEQKTKIEEISRRLQRINHFKWGIPIETYLAHESSIITSLLEQEEETFSLEDAETFRLEGDRLREKAQYIEAIKSYDKALKIEPNDKSAWNGRGIALDELGRYEEAIKAYDKAVEISPNYAWAWNGRGIALRKLKRYEEAIKAYDKAIEISPNYKFAWYNRGIALRELGRYEEAIKSYDKAIEIDSNYGYAWDNRGIALDELGRYEEAIKSHDKAIEIDPNHRNAWYNRGIALRKLERYEEAIKSYDKAIEIDPNHRNAWYSRGNALDELERYEEAIKSYDKAVEIDPNYAWAWHNRGIALRKLGRYEEAIKSYDKAIEIDPNDKDTWNNRGVALEKLGRYKEAIKSYDKAVEIDPNHDTAINNKKRLLEKLK